MRGEFVRATVVFMVVCLEKQKTIILGQNIGKTKTDNYKE